jgi:hypothetical protein
MKVWLRCSYEMVKIGICRLSSGNVSRNAFKTYLWYNAK